MIIVDIWNSNRSRCGGRFNLYFFWLYPLCAPMTMAWDFLTWLEHALTPNEKRS